MRTGDAGAAVGSKVPARYLLDTNHAGAILRSNARLMARFAAMTGAEMGLRIPSIAELGRPLLADTV
jgi:predicted nucleic acid-binding protein